MTGRTSIHSFSVTLRPLRMLEMVSLLLKMVTVTALWALNQA
jgi:hypothetical protein